MKKSILVLLFVCITVLSFSQEKKYTTYRVKENETLSSIARKIGVTTFDLEKLNPDAKNGIHIDEVLIIPNKKYKQSILRRGDLKTRKKGVTVFKDSIRNGILYHKVRAGETIYSLSKKYHVKKKKILRLNHLKKRANIKVGQLIKIPTDKKDTEVPKHIVIEDTTSDKYKKHKVKAGETEYTLAKINNISIKELENLNPFLKQRGLKEGDEILIPKVSKPKKEEVLENNEEKLYTITEQDTFYNFTHNLGYTKEELIALNPQLKDGLKVGMQILLPTKENEQIENVSYKLYQVGFQETFYMLEKKYGITKEELIALNPKLEEGLKEGMTIKIPIINSEKLEDANIMPESEIHGKKVNLALLLPFKADHSVDFSINNNNTIFTNKIMDFYFGALIALDSLKSKGLNVHLKVLDTKNDPKEIQKIKNKYDFSNQDAIIGPLVFNRFKEFTANFPMDSIPLISPTSKKNHALIFKSNIVQNTPKKEDIENKMLQYIKDNYSNQNIVIVADEDTQIEPKLQRVQQFLKQNDSIKKITVLRMEKNQIKREEFDKTVLKDKENWLILVTHPKKPTTTSVVVNTLGAYPTDYKIILFTLEKGKNFIDAVLSNKDLNRLNVHFPLDTFIDTEDSSVRKFIEKYTKKFGSRPSAYSFKGFDAVYDTAIRLANYQKMDALYQAGNSYRLADKFQYQKVPYQGYYNKGVYIVEMNNFHLMIANETVEEKSLDDENTIKTEKK